MCQISVIVPVYQTEEFLCRCLDSILRQDYHDFELLLIDDGSSDHSAAICNEYAQKDARVCVIHQKNRGAAAARNAGLHAVQGAYIAFCDSDDLVSPFWLGRMLKYSAEDTLCVGAYCLDQKALGTRKELLFPAGERLPRGAYWEFQKAGLAGYLWNALYETRVVRRWELSFPERSSLGDYNEDLTFALNYVNHVQNILYTGFSDYLYDVREGSLSRKASALYFNKYAEKFRLWRGFLQQHRNGAPDCTKELCGLYLWHFLKALDAAAANGNYQQFCGIVRSQELQQCVRTADCAEENPMIIRLIAETRCATLWSRLKLSRFKHGIFGS